MNSTIDLLARRRSLPPAGLAAPGPQAEELALILKLAARVPDHGKLAPWRFVLFEGDARAKAGDIIAATFKAEENMAVGNVALYGATAGEVYIRGMAGERFAVRNSGVSAVVEGIGDNGCEYMTGGRVVILGTAGRNFGAGMSGGIGYVLDETGDFAQRINLQMVGIEKLESPAEIAAVRDLFERHADYTQSTRARQILAAWDQYVPKFVKVMPKDYKRMLASIDRAQAQGLTGDEAIMAAFEDNARDLSRVGGN